MKKAISVFVALIMIFAAGCEKQKISETAPPAAPVSFSSKLEVSYGDTSMTAELNKLSENEFRLQILTPEILSPLSLYYKDESCTVTYDGLKFETDLNRFPQVSFGTLLTHTIADVETGIDIEKTYADGIWTYKGTSERGVFVLTQNAETGQWLELSIDSASLKVVFSDFTTAEKAQ